MIRRPLLVAAAFAVSALVLFGALARITAMTLALERSERSALQRATQEENVRIALWRLDATLAELIALENTRPAARFRSASEPAGLLRVSGLVRARFEVGADRKLRSEPSLAAPVWAAALPLPEQPPRRRRPPPPPVPTPEPEPEAVVVAETTPEPVAQQQEERRLGIVTQDELERVPTARDPWANLQTVPGVQIDRINVGGNESGQQSAYTQEALNTQSFQRRKELAQQSTLVRPTDMPPGMEVESAFEARWMEGDLVLLRRVRRGDERLLQGTWLDWPALRSFLLARIEPVVPASSLQPAADGEGDPGRRLALLPARLVPGPMPETEPRDWTPVRLSIAAAWAAAVLGFLGVGSLLKASVTLSQRRADFVSAVTHELRTPLTTFRLYTEMLLDGMVPAEERPSYLAILKREADRLGHLVDNVLTFSRLERRAAATRIEVLPLADLLERVVPRLRDRAALEIESGTPEARVRVDVASAEQILLNLVDNACKYAPGQPPRLSSSLRGRYAVLRFQDQGPGIDPRDRRRIFLPFHRSADRAAGSAPGVGLGLALSRRLARRMGGDLRLADSEGGAAFELWLRT